MIAEVVDLLGEMFMLDGDENGSFILYSHGDHSFQYSLYFMDV